MRKHLPNIAIVVGALIVGATVIYAVARLAHLYLAGSSTATLKMASAQITLLCFIVVPFGSLAIAGGVIWRRSFAEAEKDRLAEWELRKRKKPPPKPGKFAR
jgi:hypothetical protein